MIMKVIFDFNKSGRLSLSAQFSRAKDLGLSNRGNAAHMQAAPVCQEEPPSATFRLAVLQSASVTTRVTS